MSGQRGDTRTPAWVDKVDEFQNFAVPRSEVIIPVFFFFFFFLLLLFEREEECVCMRETERERDY